MLVQLEVPYLVIGALPGRRNTTRGIATVRKSYDLREVAGDVDLPPAFAVTQAGSVLSRERNIEGHDVYSTVILDGRPWMAIQGDMEASEVIVGPLLNDAVRRRISRFVGPKPENSELVDRTRFREIVEDRQVQSEQVADEVISRMMLWRGRLWERDIVPMYAVHAGDRPDVSVVPSSSARYNFFDHFLPDDRDEAMAMFVRYGGKRDLPSIVAALDFPQEREAYRPLIARSAKDLLEAMEDGIYADCVGRWRLRLGGEKLLKAAELIEARGDDDSLPFGELAQALHTLIGVAAGLRPAPDDLLSEATDMARHRIDTLLRLLAAEQANHSTFAPR
jgi:hypothetical protein